MTLDQLKVFVAVAERLHVTQAASALHITQSAVSASIAALEFSSKVRLFNRVGRSVELTQAGELFLIAARSVLKYASNAEFILGELANLKLGKIAIGASQAIANYWIPSRLLRFHERYPEIKVSLKIGNTLQIESALLDGEIDIGIVEGTVSNAAVFFKESYVGDRLVLVVGDKHIWAKRKSVKGSDLVATPWILRERGSATRALFDSMLIYYGIDTSKLQILLELPTNEAVLTVVAAGAGATVVSELAVLQHGLVVIDFPLPAREFTVLQHRERMISSVQRAFIELLMD